MWQHKLTCCRVCMHVDPYPKMFNGQNGKQETIIQNNVEHVCMYECVWVSEWISFKINLITLNNNNTDSSQGNNNEKCIISYTWVEFFSVSVLFHFFPQWDFYELLLPLMLLLWILFSESLFFLVNIHRAPSDLLNGKVSGSGKSGRAGMILNCYLENRLRFKVKDSADPFLRKSNPSSVESVAWGLL